MLIHKISAAMAGTSVYSFSYILMKDTHGEKANNKIISILRSGPKQVQVLLGELLTLISHREIQTRNDGKPAHNYRLKKDPNVTLYCEDDDVAPLSRDNMELLEAIQKPWARFAVFSEDNKLEWGGRKLKKGSLVYVKLHTGIWSFAVVQYVGIVETLKGRNFGVEIIVSLQYRYY